MDTRLLNNVLITGGSGFIGSNFIRFILDESDFTGRVINLDALTYAGNAESLDDVYRRYHGTRYFFEHGSICDAGFTAALFSKYDIDTVVHFAAESHVDRSIEGPEAFVTTNVLGTQILLDAARKFWKPAGGAMSSGVLFHHISTDEVYGSLGGSGYFTETTPYDPRSPYSASKAASDHLVMSYYHTYGLPVTLSNCSNNYGPYQFPEKLIPLMILNMREGKPLPVYGDGKNIRDWIYVEDHNRAVYCIMRKGGTGETYNIGGDNEWENIKLIDTLASLVAQKAGLDKEAILSAIRYVADRPGHDRRYAIDCSKLKRELGWKQTTGFADGLAKTVDWYLAHDRWISHVKSGDYQQWIAKNYDGR